MERILFKRVAWLLINHYLYIMKILLGAHGTGKSTLLKAIGDLRPDYYTTDGFSRPIKTVRDQIGLNPVGEQILINELTRWAYENYIPRANVLAGRSLIDAIVMSNLLYPEINTGHLEATFLLQKDKIDAIFYIPIEFGLEDDGVRMTEKAFQEDVNEAMLTFCSKHNIPIIRLSGSVEERIATVLPYL